MKQSHLSTLGELFLSRRSGVASHPWRSSDHPLALYVFSQNAEFKEKGIFQFIMLLVFRTLECRPSLLEHAVWSCRRE